MTLHRTALIITLLMALLTVEPAHAAVAPVVPVEVSIAGAVAKERTGAPSRLQFVVKLNRASDEDVSVRVATLPVSSPYAATRGVDFVNRVADLTIPAGSRSTRFTVQVVGDRTDEWQEEYLRARIMSASVDIAARGATGTIDDDDLPPVVRLVGSAVEEGGYLRIAVRMSHPSHTTVDVGVHMRHVTTDDDDFNIGPYSHTIVVPAGAIAATGSFWTRDDDVAEGPERLVGWLGGAIDATAAPGTSTFTLLDDERP